MFDLIKRDLEIAKLKKEIVELKEELLQKSESGLEHWKSITRKRIYDECEKKLKNEEYKQYVANCNHIAVALASNPSCPKSILYDLYNKISEPFLRYQSKPCSEIEKQD